MALTVAQAHVLGIDNHDMPSLQAHSPCWV